MTPEGMVKKAVRKLLESYERVHISMPVQNGMGKQMLDFHCAVAGHALVIETKAPGGKPTPRQEITIQELRDAGAAVFVVSLPPDFDDLRRWLDAHTSQKAVPRT